MLSWRRATGDTANVHFSLRHAGAFGVKPLPTTSFDDNHTPVMVCCPGPNLPCALSSVIIYLIPCGSKEPQEGIFLIKFRPSLSKRAASTFVYLPRRFPAIHQITKVAPATSQGRIQII